MRIQLTLALSLTGLVLVPAIASSGVVLGPELDLTGAQKQEVGKTVGVKVACPDEVCSAIASGKIQLLGGNKGVKKSALKLKPAAQVIPVKFFRLKPKLKKAGLKAVRKAIRNDRRAKAKISVTATDVNGGTTTETKTVELKRVGFHNRDAVAAP